MSRLAYVNGRLVPLADATVHIEDRGFQFADGVYEVAATLNGRMLDWPQHVARLGRSLRELSIAAPMSDAALSIVARRVLAANRIRDGLLYVQVTRGAARRDHPFPTNAVPTLVMTARPFDFRVRVAQQKTGISVITQPESRWQRRDIKSIALLPNVLAKQSAREAKAFEAWFVNPDGTVSEGSSTNAWIVRKDGTIVTHPATESILHGVMRGTLLALAREHQIRVEEAPFTTADALDAAEAFLTSTTAPCLPIISIDGNPVGKGVPGPVTARLAEALWAEVERQTGWQR
ncbi:D-amino-acid transaminase [Sphingosinicella sp.]|mgnify:CR=1 FL=1|uniref:D-amino-acid transaminase n=1 Tax=Sphingosinicella sp. TaxID=1917971 RepID=UPI002633C62C|nr:D-amino-acid transaminase [Sphingosinicella sp.]